jgi:hypothetical protein
MHEGLPRTEPRREARFGMIDTEKSRKQRTIKETDLDNAPTEETPFQHPPGEAADAL